FETSWTGDEQLSTRGKALLDGSLTHNGDPLTSSPIVVEGYSTADVLARSRAIVVRQYLQTRFKIDPRSIGVVPLKNSPPKGFGRSTWDGICVVVLKAS